MISFKIHCQCAFFKKKKVASLLDDKLSTTTTLPHHTVFAVSWFNYLIQIQEYHAAYDIFVLNLN